MKSVLITRPEPQARLFAATLPKGYEPVLSPLIKIVPTGESPDLTGISGLIFTSVNAVKMVHEQLAKCPLPAWCVGRRTGEAAKALGMTVQVGNGDAQALITKITEQNPAGKLLHIRGQHSAGDVVGQLNAAGIRAESVIVYRQDRVVLTPQAKASLRNGDFHAVMLFSVRTAKIFTEETAEFSLKGTRLLCLSRNVAEALGRQQKARIEIAARPDQSAMLELLGG